jgi:hypothetical protein
MCWDALTVGALSGKGKKSGLGEKEETQKCPFLLILTEV